jgi:hypothetical protein
MLLVVFAGCTQSEPAAEATEAPAAAEATEAPSEATEAPAELLPVGPLSLQSA